MKESYRNSRNQQKKQSPILSARTHQTSTTKKPELTRQFYEQLSTVITSFKPAREALIIGGDFNAKTRTKPNTYPQNINRKVCKKETLI